MTAPQLLQPVEEVDGLAAVHTALIQARLERHFWQRRGPRVLDDGTIEARLSVIDPQGYTLAWVYLQPQLAALLPGWAIDREMVTWFGRVLLRVTFRKG